MTVSSLVAPARVALLPLRRSRGRRTRTKRERCARVVAVKRPSGEQEIGWLHGNFGLGDGGSLTVAPSEAGYGDRTVVPASHLVSTCPHATCGLIEGAATHGAPRRCMRLAGGFVRSISLRHDGYSANAAQATRPMLGRPSCTRRRRSTSDEGGRGESRCTASAHDETGPLAAFWHTGILAFRLLAVMAAPACTYAHGHIALDEESSPSSSTSSRSTACVCACVPVCQSGPHGYVMGFGKARQGKARRVVAPCPHCCSCWAGCSLANAHAMYMPWGLDGRMRPCRIYVHTILLYCSM